MYIINVHNKSLEIIHKKKKIITCTIIINLVFDCVYIPTFFCIHANAFKHCCKRSSVLQ